MKCNHCGQEIQDNSKFCPFCGVEQSEQEVIQENTKSWQRLEKNNTVNIALICGSLSLFFSLIIGGLISVAGLLLAPICLYFSIRNFKPALLKKAVLGLAFGVLGIIFGIINLINIRIAWKAIEEMENECQEKIEITISDAELGSFLLHNNPLSPQSYHVNQYQYRLTEAKRDELIQQRSDWQHLPLPTVFRNAFTDVNLNFSGGSYLFYDNITNTVAMPEVEDDYDFMLVIIDTQNNKLYIYEFWK